MGKPRRALAHLRAGTLPAAVRYKLGRHRPEPRLREWPVPGVGGTSARRLEALRQALPGADAYLEVGLSRGATFERVGFPLRVGVDPRPRFDVTHLPRGAEVHVTTSDDFFARDRRPFDVVFLDGLHTFEQTYTDLVNALDRAVDGAILIDDVVPSDEVSAMPDLDGSMAERRRRGTPSGVWHGGVYKVVELVERHHPELDFRVIVGSGNPQAVVWLVDPSARLGPVDEATFREVDSLGYGDVFADGVPSRFRPAAESEAIAAAAAGLGPRRGRR